MFPTWTPRVEYYLKFPLFSTNIFIFYYGQLAVIVWLDYHWPYPCIRLQSAYTTKWRPTGLLSTVGDIFFCFVRVPWYLNLGIFIFSKFLYEKYTNFFFRSTSEVRQSLITFWVVFLLVEVKYTFCVFWVQ